MVVVLVLVIGGIFGYIKTQRELVNLDEKCKNALSQIEVQLNSRWDALMSLAKAATSYAQHEAETLAATQRPWLPPSLHVVVWKSARLLT